MISGAALRPRRFFLGRRSYGPPPPRGRPQAASMQQGRLRAAPAQGRGAKGAPPALTP